MQDFGNLRRALGRDERWPSTAESGRRRLESLREHPDFPTVMRCCPGLGQKWQESWTVRSSERVIREHGDRHVTHGRDLAAVTHRAAAAVSQARREPVH